MGCMSSGAENAARNSMKDWKKAWADIDSWLAPYREGGEQGFQEFVRRAIAGPGAFTDSPQYRFMVDESLKAADRAAGARGQLFSGVHQQNLVERAQNLAMLGEQDWLNKWYMQLNPLAQISQIGLNAANQSGNFKIQTTQGLTNARMALGEAKDAGAHNLFTVGSGLAGTALFGLGLFGAAGKGPLKGLAQLGKKTTTAATVQPLSSLGGSPSSFGAVPGVYMPPVSSAGMGWT